MNVLAGSEQGHFLSSFADHSTTSLAYKSISSNNPLRIWLSLLVMIWSTFFQGFWNSPLFAYDHYCNELTVKQDIFHLILPLTHSEQV